MNYTQQKLTDYDGFVEKFKPKKTTDDCYTPQPVYDAVLEWVRDEYHVDESTPILRPFKPGGDLYPLLIRIGLPYASRRGSSTLLINCFRFSDISG